MSAVGLSAGAVVRFRDRLWRVDQVNDGVFTATPLDGRDLYPRRFATRLEQIEDGRMPFPDPTRTTDPTEQDLLLRANELSLVHGSAPILGLQRSRAIPTPYQLVPLLMALGADRVRLLIADDVGIGKTVEAGLVLAELLARGLARRVLVVVPANLREQWQEALDHFFHLDGTIISSDRLPALERRLLPGQSPWEAHNLVVASVDYLKLHRHLVLQYPWDVAIVDEAHLCARPHRRPGAPPPDMKRWEFAQALAEKTRHLLLLTATPHSGYTDSYASLLGLLDTDLVVGETIKREDAKRHVCQRRRRDIESWYAERGSSPFPAREQDEIVVTPSKEQLQLLDQLRLYTDELDARAQAAPLNAWVAAHLQKRALSSPHAFRETIERRLKRVAQRQAQELDRRREEEEARISVTDSLGGEGMTDEQRSERVDRAPSTLDTDRELEYLRSLLELAKKVTPAKDTKLKRLKELVPSRADRHPQARRVIVFTRYKDTLDYLEKHLKKLHGFQVFTIYGDLSQAQRRLRLTEFERSERAVLVATDAISEGMNLQSTAAELVHYELPWNPNRLEQRNGRIDRFGQREPFVGIRTLVLDDRLDLAILDVNVRKAREIREEYGFAPPFFGGGETIRGLLRKYGRRRQLSFFDESMEEEAIFFDKDQLERVRTESFYGQTDVGLGEVEEALERTRAVVGSPDRLRTFVERALALFGCELVERRDGTYSISGSHSELADAVPSDATPLAFDPDLARLDPDVDVLDLAHPLVRTLVDSVRDRSLGAVAPGRVTGWATSATEEVAAVLHILARYVTSSTPPVVLEELVAVSFPVWDDGTPPEPDALFAGDQVAAGYGATDVADAAAEVLARSGLRPRIEAELERRRAGFAERHSRLEGGWAAGLEDVSVASWDPLAITIFFPGA
jgi:superfamily II DNA or RNA helicase